MPFEPTYSKCNYIIPFPHRPTMKNQIKMCFFVSMLCDNLSLSSLFIKPFMCTFAWKWKDTNFKFCINDGELVGNIWGKKKKKKKRGESWEGICSIWNLALGQKHYTCLVKQFRMSLIRFVRLWRSIIMNLDALLYTLFQMTIDNVKVLWVVVVKVMTKNYNDDWSIHYGHDNVCQHNSNVDIIILVVNDGIK